MNKEDAALEIYKMSVEMADRLSARRSKVNAFFITLEVAFATSLGVIGSKESNSSHKLLFLLGGLALTVTLIWWVQLTSYRNISIAKFKVIHELEKDLASSPYTHEWALLRNGNKKPWWTGHIDISKTERAVPFVFLIIDIITIWTRSS